MLPLPTIGLGPHFRHRSVRMVVTDRGRPDMIFVYQPFYEVTLSDPVPLEQYQSVFGILEVKQMHPNHPCSPTISVGHHPFRQRLHWAVGPIGDENHRVDSHACLFAGLD